MVHLQKSQCWKDYEVIQEIGRGGMGVVYKARQISLQRIVAIKFSYSNYIDDERFFREMQIAAKLHHALIPKIYDAGVENNYKYLVMDYINGISLHQYLQQYHLSLSQKLQLFTKICKVVRYAHRKGIIHRDLKPSNIMMTKNHEPMIIDFGLAKHIENENFDFTKTGDLVGTPNYMAPEQITGTRTAINEQVDIYALGAILYEMVSGQMMIHGTNLLQILCCIQDEKFPRLSQVADLPNKNLENVWAKAVAQKKCDRYQSLSEFITDIKNVCRGKTVRQKRTLWPFIAIVGIVILLVVSLYDFGHKTPLLKNTRRDSSFVNIMQCIHEHKFQHAKQLIASSSLNTTENIRIAKALYREGQYQEAKTIFDKVPAQFYDKLYYDSFIAYYLQQYKMAEQGFTQLLIINNQDAKYHYYLGLCYLHQKDHSHALAHLLEAEKSFSTNLQLLEYIAQIYLSPSYKRIKKAEEYLLRCLDISNNGAKYALLLGKIYTETKQYYKAFVYLKKSIDINTSFKALQLLHEIPYHEPRLRRLCYYSIMSNYKTEKTIKPIDLFQEKWASIEKHYQQNYISWLQGIKNREKSIKSFLKPIRDTKLKKIMKDALINLRYSKTFDSDIEKAIQNPQNPQEFKKFLQETRSEVYKAKQREIYAKTYYQLVYMHRTNQYTQGVTSKLLIKILHEERSPFLKYLAVKAHLQIFGFEPIISIANDKKDDIWVRIICCAVLRQHHLAAKVDVFQHLLRDTTYVGQDLEFIQVLVAQSLYTVHSMKRRDTSYRYDNVIPEKETKLLVYLWEQVAQKTSLAAALSLFGLYQEAPESLKQWGKIEETIFAAFQSQNFNIKNYTHFVFWNSLYSKQKNHYFTLYKKALEDTNEMIREIALYHVELYRERIGEIMPQLEKCLSSSVERVRFRALFAWTFRQSKNVFFVDPLYQKRKDTFTALEHTSIVLFLFYKFFWDTRGQQINRYTIQNVARFFSYLDENLHTLPPSSQCMISYTLSLVGIHRSLSDLQKVDNEKLLAYYLCQLHQEVRFEKQPGKVNYLTFIPKTNKREKMYTARHFIRHKNETVRKYALSSFLAFASQDKQQPFLQQALASTDVSLRKSTAHGLYLSFCNAWIDAMHSSNSAINFLDMFSSKPLYLLLIDNFNKMQQFVLHLRTQYPQKFLYYKKNIALAQQLNPQESIYAFVSSFFDTKKLVRMKINDAIQINKKYEGGHLLALYNINLLEAYTKNYSQKEALSYMQKIDVNKINTHLATKIGKIYLDLKLYPQALRMYEKNFLYKSTEYAPFYAIIEDHCQMVYIYKKQSKTKSAHILFDYLYELYRRKEWGHSSITKELFSKKSRKIVER